MDTRLHLTPRQQELVKNLVKAIDALQREHVGMMLDPIDTDFLLFNATDVLGYAEGFEYSFMDDGYAREPHGWHEGISDEGCVWHTPKRNDLVRIPLGLTMYSDNAWFAVQLRENEESDTYFREGKSQVFKR